MKTRRWGPAASAVTLGIFVLACEAGTDDQRTGTITQEEARQARQGLPAEMAAVLDSGNAAYRREDYEAARGYFRKLVERDSTLAAGWFGIYMTEKALGNQDAAEAALEEAARHSGSSSLGPAAPSRPEGRTGTAEG